MGRERDVCQNYDSAAALVDLRKATLFVNICVSSHAHSTNAIATLHSGIYERKYKDRRRAESVYLARETDFPGIFPIYNFCTLPPPPHGNF